MKRSILLIALLLPSGPAPAAPVPGEALKPGDRACFGMNIAKNDMAKLPAHGVIRMLLELHREQFEGQDPILWGRLYAELKGEPKPGYVYDGCEPAAEGTALTCSIACDGGNFTVAAEGEGVRLTVGSDGAYLKSCGSSLEEIGGFSIAPADLPQGAALNAIDDKDCRTVMQRFEKLLEDEENAIE